MVALALSCPGWGLGNVKTTTDVVHPAGCGIHRILRRLDSLTARSLSRINDKEIRVASSVKTLHFCLILFSLKYFWPSSVPRSQPVNSLQLVEPNFEPNSFTSFLTIVYDSATVSVGAFLPANMPITMIPPLTAPHIPHVRETPPQKPVAILGIRSDWIPSLSATARSTLSAQYMPDSKSSPLRFAILSIIFLSSYGRRSLRLCS